MIGGPKGIEYEVYCHQMESLFYESLDEIKSIRDDILDVTKSSWLENILKFRNFVMELENMVKNLIDRIFEEIKNVEEGIEAIYALQRFKHRESLQDILSSKWVQVRKASLLKKIKIRMRIYFLFCARMCILTSVIINI